VEHYRTKMTSAAVLMGANEEFADGEMERVLNFEKTMAKVQEEVKEIEKVSKMKVDQLMTTSGKRCQK